MDNNTYMAVKSEAVAREQESPYSEAVVRVQDALDRHEMLLDQVHARTYPLRSSAISNGAKLESMDHRGGSQVVVYLHTLAERVERLSESLGILLYELEI